MKPLSLRSRVAAAMLLAALLVAAEGIAVTHAYEHDPGATTDPACASCVLAGQLASACADAPTHTAAFAAPAGFIAENRSSGDSLSTPTAKQRSPPLSP